MPRIRVETPSIGSNDGPMLCRHGCPLPVYPGFGCCRGCVTQDEPRSVPWVECARCRRAVDVLLGPLATDEDRMCPLCRDRTMIEVIKDEKTFGFASNERDVKRLIHAVGKSIFALGADELENRSDSLRLRGAWDALRSMGAFVSDEIDSAGYGKVFVVFEMSVKTKDGKFRGEYECMVECEVTDREECMEKER